MHDFFFVFIEKANKDRTVSFHTLWYAGFIKSLVVSWCLKFVFFPKFKRVLHQLRRDHAGVQNPNRRKFTSVEDALQRLLPYHVFQGAPPCQNEFSQGKVVKKTDFTSCRQGRLRLALIYVLENSQWMTSSRTLRRRWWQRPRPWSINTDDCWWWRLK